jgi:hypothetical protein
MTKGEYRVECIPGDDMASEIRRRAADLIDLIEKIGMKNVAPGALPANPEVRRLKALAQTAIEEGCMWAVKAEMKELWA